VDDGESTEDEMSGPLAGMAAWVTGGGGGIGSESALALARDGAAVTLMGRTETTLEAARERLLAEVGAEAVVQYVVGDATNASDMDKATEAAHGLAEGLRICVATVGGGNGTTAPLLVLDEQMLLDVYNFNVVSAFLAMKYSTPRMADAGGGSIVCISSTAAHSTSPYLASYVAAKAGLEAFVRVAAVELSSFGIRVNAVRPGNVATRPRSEAEIARGTQFAARLPLGRIGVPVDIAGGVRYLAGPESAWVTGQSYAIDGGSEIIPVAPPFDAVVRQRFGDEVIDAALGAKIPNRPR
jgi:NAD(P)-dependent dehydrogenase (short-subunit alcohol dehydrogenase family)